jgi:hypothetical protein
MMMKWKVFARKRSWPNLNVLSRHSPAMTEENHDKNSISIAGRRGLCVQTSSEAHPASYSMGTDDPFSRVKHRPGRDADHSPSSSAKVKNE